MTAEINGKSVTEPAAVIRPFQRQDDWAMTSSGAVAFIRAQTAAIDWVDPEGTHSSATVAHEWRRLSSDDKIAIMDSLRTYYASHPPTMP